MDVPEMREIVSAFVALFEKYVPPERQDEAMRAILEELG